MSRTNAVGQQTRSKSGREHENYLHVRLERMLEKSKLDEYLELKRQFKVGEHVRVDIAICNKATGLPQFFFGAKSSFRERWKLDAYDCNIAKQVYPGIPWAEVTSSEHDEWTSSKIIAHCLMVKTRTNWDYCVSTKTDEFVILLDNIRSRLNVVH